MAKASDSTLILLRFLHHGAPEPPGLVPLTPQQPVTLTPPPSGTGGVTVSASRRGQPVRAHVTPSTTAGTSHVTRRAEPTPEEVT